MVAIGSPMPITVNTDTLFYYFGAGIIIMLIASISPASKTSKLNIITSLKYE
jgi:putative ABC transport system permease protein